MNLVDQVLEFAASAKGPSPEIRPLKIAEIVDSALTSTQAMLQESGFLVEQSLSTELPYVVGDLSMLSLCLENLITNAVKYSGESRWIGISADLDTLSGGGPVVKIEVRDRGLGIDEVDLDHVFEPFYRCPKVIARQIHGSGLGLSIAKRTAEALGATLSAKSKLGVGSTFTLCVPVMPQDEVVPSWGTERRVES
jgi:signal transduction histidine kinase